MAIFTALAGVIVGAIGITGVAATIATAVIGGAMAFGVSKLIGPRNPGGSVSDQQEDAVTGARIQLPPATNNKLPVVYGTAFIGGSIIDAKISSDLQTMWYVIALAEVTNTMPGNSPDNITFDELYYDGKLVTLSGSSVTALTTNTAGGGEVDTKINGYLDMYLFRNGSYSGVNTGGQSAIQIMSDSAIPANQRWNQGIYTAGGQNPAMTNTAFIIVKVKYNQDAGTTGLGVVTAKITNSRTLPGDCIKDYLLNDRYGCGVPLSAIDQQSLTDLNTYSNKPVVYTPVGGGATTTQPRYRLNGPVDTSKNCLANLQDMVDACDSWMQYTEITGKWKVVINKAYNETPNSKTLASLYHVTDNNLIGGININPTDLNNTYNQVEYQYPNTYIKDQLDYIFIALQDEYPSLLSENEPLNKLTIKSDLVNNYVQAKFIAIRRLLQAREDLIVTLKTDYSGIQVEAGDVIRITNNIYGWTEKLFRVSNVVEEKDGEGNLFASLTAFEYNNSIYDDDLDITDFIPEDNTGLKDPNIIQKPNPPTVVVDTAATLYEIDVTGVVPPGGLVRYLDFNYGTSNNSATHTYYTTSTNANGAPLTAGQTFKIDVNDIKDAGNLYWSVTAKNDTVGVRSDSSTVISWPGSGVNTITGNNIQANTVTYVNLAPGAAATVLGGYTYQAANQIANTTVTPVSVTTFSTNIKSLNFATPKYNTTTYTGGGGYFPYATGNSSTTDGYVANSTAPWTPAFAAQLQVLNGDLNWWVLEYDTISSVVTTNESLVFNARLQMVSFGNVTIQLAPFVTLNSTGNTIIVDTDSSFFTYELSDLKPINVDIELSVAGANTIDGGGILIRNMTGGGNVTTSFGSFQLTKTKI